MKKPSNRKERLDFLSKKKGYNYITNFLYFTDKELKIIFDKLYENLKKEEDYNVLNEKFPTCLKCGKEVVPQYECWCNDSPVFDENQWEEYIKECLDNNYPLDKQDIEFMNNGYKLSKQN